MRGVKSLHPEDIIFLIRHDKVTVNRLNLFLCGKDARKVEKDDNTDVDELESMLPDEEEGKIVSQCHSNHGQQPR